MNNKKWLTAILIISILAIAFFWNGTNEKSTTKLEERNPKSEVTTEATVSPQITKVQQNEEANRKAGTETKKEDEPTLQQETKDSSTIVSEKPTEIQKPAVAIEEKLEKKPEEEKSKIVEKEAVPSTQSKPEPTAANPETKKDKYLTDPVPDGKPKPVEWQDATINKNKELTITLSVTSKTILDNMNKFNKDKLEVLPPDGIIYKTRTVTFYEGESVFDVLLREMKKNKIHMEFKMTPIYNSNYVEGINNLYEFDCGELSGWMYKVNGWFPNYGSSRYVLKDKDVVEWVYTCDLGRDVGGDKAAVGG